MKRKLFVLFFSAIFLSAFVPATEAGPLQKLFRGRFLHRFAQPQPQPEPEPQPQPAPHVDPAPQPQPQPNPSPVPPGPPPKADGFTLLLIASPDWYSTAAPKQTSILTDPTLLAYLDAAFSGRRKFYLSTAPTDTMPEPFKSHFQAAIAENKTLPWLWVYKPDGTTALSEVLPADAATMLADIKKAAGDGKPGSAAPQCSPECPCHKQCSADWRDAYEIECPCLTHPKTAVVRCPVNPACPDSTGEATATVFDYTTKPPTGESAKTLHKIKSRSPCGCVAEFEICKCVANGTYKGTCTKYLCTYEIPCQEKPADTAPPPRPAKNVESTSVMTLEDYARLDAKFKAMDLDGEDEAVIHR